MLSAFIEAVRFLTLIPLPSAPAQPDEDYERTVARATRWFPLVGLLIGGLGCAAGWFERRRLADVAYLQVAGHLKTRGLAAAVASTSSATAVPPLRIPRRDALRAHVPAGMAGIYPAELPGGWHIIRRTALRLFDPLNESQPASLQAGDGVH